MRWPLKRWKPPSGSLGPVEIWAASVLRLAKVIHERLDRREDYRLRIAEQAFVVLDFVELVGERLDLLHLVVDHLNELGDLLPGSELTERSW